MKYNKKALFSVIEIGLLLSLFSFSLFYLFSNSVDDSNLNSNHISSLVHNLIQNSTHVNTIINEDLSLTNPSQDWSSIRSILSQELNTYSIIISNLTSSKNINSCEGEIETQFAQSFVAGSSTSNTYEFRSLTIGVCY